MIGILDYGAGNLRSVCNALDRIQVTYFISDDPIQLDSAEKLIFPGVGHAGSAIQALQKSGLDNLLQNTKKPLLGICLGMQLLFDFTEEGDTPCLGIIPGTVRKFDFQKVGIVPHMGWNKVNFTSPFFDPLIGATQGRQITNYKMAADDFYYIHSYYCDPKNPDDIVGKTDYNGQIFCSAMKQGNIFAVQFHPEKSGLAGQHLLQWFCEQNI